MKGKIKYSKCPECGEEYRGNVLYCINKVHPKYTEPRTLPVYKDKEVKKFSSLTVGRMFKTTANGGVVLRDAKGTEYEVYLSDFIKFLEGKKIRDVILQEKVKGDVLAWEVITDDTSKDSSSSRWF